MTTVRAAKSKGSQLEYDAQYSLSFVYPDIYRTSERGFQLQYDLRDDTSQTIFECKRLKGMSWNQAMKFYLKLEQIKDAAQDVACYLIFQSNRQPALVMFRDQHNVIMVTTFEEVFSVEFKKHPSTRKRKV